MISQIHIIPKIYSPWGAELFSTQPKKEKEKEEENPNSTIFSSSSNSTKLRWVGGKKNSQLNPPKKMQFQLKHLYFCMGLIIRIIREIQCLPYAGFFVCTVRPV